MVILTTNILRFGVFTQPGAAAAPGPMPSQGVFSRPSPAFNENSATWCPAPRAYDSGPQAVLQPDAAHCARTATRRRPQVVWRPSAPCAAAPPGWASK